MNWPDGYENKVLNGDQHRIDSHKLMYHPWRVANWLHGSHLLGVNVPIPPIYVEISPSGKCNHRCTFCGFSYTGYDGGFIDTNLLKEGFRYMGKFGVKSVLFAGNGEPLLHPDIGELIYTARAAGMDVALVTNGVLLKERVTPLTLSCLTWIKVSVDAGTAKTHAAIHGTSEKDFAKILAGLQHLVSVRTRGANIKTTIGVQMVLLPENKGEALSLAMDMRAIGVDYLAIKPYTVAPQSDNGIAVEFDGDELIDLKWDLEDQESDTFKVIFRVDTIADMERDRVYDKCFAAPFWAYIDEKGDIWGCYDYLGDDRFRYGNIGDDNNGWYGSGDEVRAAMDEACPTCRRGCRMDKANQYLWELLHPDPHVNFI